MKNAFKICFTVLLFILFAFKANAENNNPVEPNIERLQLGQDQNVLQRFPNITPFENKKLGTLSYTIQQKNKRVLIVVIDTNSHKIVQIALIQKSDGKDNDAVFGHFRFNQTRLKDMILSHNGQETALFKNQLLQLASPYNLTPENTREELYKLTESSYFLNDGSVISFITKQANLEDLNVFNPIQQSGNAFIINPTAGYRIKSDNQYAYRLFKALILTEPDFAKKLDGKTLNELTLQHIEFLNPDPNTPTEKNPFQLSKQYQTTKIYDGRKHALSFNDHNKVFSNFQTRTKQGYEQITKPLFASEYGVISVYFHANSNDYYFYNLHTGQIYKFPLGQNNHALKLIMRPDLSVLEARFEDKGLCKKAYYHFNKGKWILLKTETAGFADICDVNDTILATYNFDQ